MPDDKFLLPSSPKKIIHEHHDCDGKIPKREIIKLTARNGIMLSCGCEPPAVVIVDGSIVTLGAAEEYCPNVDWAQTPFPGLDWLPAPEFPRGTWLCAGI